MSGASPTVRQRELGTRLRKLRQEQRMTVEDVAAKLLCSATKISRVETAARRPTLRDVRDLCELYGVDKDTTDQFMGLAREAREQGWWTQYSDLNLNPFIGLEQEATSITTFMMSLFPGLLQTDDYARVVIKAIAPKIDPAVLQERVEARLRRQELLERGDPPRYRVLLDEAVIARLVGGPEVMAAQIGKVLDSVRAGKATVQVIPFDIGAHAAQDSNFVLFEFADTRLPPVVFVEGLVKHQYQERSVEAGRYREALEHLRDSALSPRATEMLLEERRKALVSGA